jgi:hypothetical protein
MKCFRFRHTCGPQEPTGYFAKEMTNSTKTLQNFKTNQKIPKDKKGWSFAHVPSVNTKNKMS